MIPKQIHCFWLKDEPVPTAQQKSINIIRKKYPDFKVIKWTKETINFENCPDYIRSAFDDNLFALVEDYLSLTILHTQGGFYVNLSDISEFLRYDLNSLTKYNACFIFEYEKWIAPYKGFGAEPSSKIVSELIKYYTDTPQSPDLIKKYGRILSYQRNHRPFLERNLVQNNITQLISDNIIVLSTSRNKSLNGYKSQLVSIKLADRAKNSTYTLIASAYKHLKSLSSTKKKKKIELSKIEHNFNEYIDCKSEISSDNAKRNIEKYHKKTKMPFSQESIFEPIYDLMIVVPVYNVEKYIEKCILSIINQNTSYSYYTVFIDDGSTDNSGAILDRYSSFDNITIIHQENKGLSGARNCGLKTIYGRYILFVDSDDYIANYTVEALMGTAYKYCADIVEGAIMSFSENEIFYPSIIADKAAQVYSDDITGFPWGKAIKGEIFTKICFPEGMLFEDTIMKELVYPECNRIFAIPDVTYFYRKNASGISATSNSSKSSVDSYWITKFYLEEKVARHQKFDKYEYELFLMQLNRNYKRMRNRPEFIQESAFILSCVLHEQYFKDVQKPAEALYEYLIETLNKRSFKAFAYIMENWDAIYRLSITKRK